MLTREILEDIAQCTVKQCGVCKASTKRTENYYKLCATDTIAKSHIAALDSIDNWKHEAFATKEMLVAANAEIDRLKGIAEKYAREIERLTAEAKKFDDTMQTMERILRC